MINPFLINAYHSPKYFCDRESEKNTLVRSVLNQTNVSLFAQRRTGKTALIQHAFHFLRKKNIHCIYVDIYSTNDITGFANVLSTAIYQTFEKKKSIWDKILQLIKHFRPIITFNEISGVPEITLDVAQKAQQEKTIPEILIALDKLKIPIVIAIDEFQQITTYKEKNVEAILRSCIQQLKYVHFIFCGSNQKLMHEIFNSAKRPFYSSTQTISIGRIPIKEYKNFIVSHFKENKRVILDEAINLALELTNSHTYYTQFLMHEIYACNEKKITTDIVRNMVKDVLKNKEDGFYQYRNILTKLQWDLLVAIAKEETVSNIYSSAFLTKYHLGSASTVRRSVMRLTETELVYHSLSVSNPYYELNDKFLMRWIKMSF